MLHLDFETRSAADLKKCGADVYAKHPTTTVLCMAYAFGDGPVQIWYPGLPFPVSVVDWIRSGNTVVAHNAPFEFLIWNHVVVPHSGIPSFSPIKTEQMICTMSLAYAMALPGALEKAAAAVGIAQQKDMPGHRIMMQLSQPREIQPCGYCNVPGGVGEGCVFCEHGFVIDWYTPSSHPEKFERLYEYCKQDIEVERLLLKRLLPLSASEREIWLLDQRINQRGVQVDLRSVKAAIQMVEMEKKRLDSTMREVTGNAVATCSAVGQLTDWLRSRGVETEGVAKTDVLDILARPEIPNDVRRALTLRQEAAKSSTAKLEAMLHAAGADGRLRGMFQYHGAGTGRWAGRRVQLQNLPRPKLSQSEIDRVFELLRGVA